jgi:hypothetical protein
MRDGVGAVVSGNFFTSVSGHRHHQREREREREPSPAEAAHRREDERGTFGTIVSRGREDEKMSAALLRVS